jgi:hypothetical protein
MSAGVLSAVFSAAIFANAAIARWETPPEDPTG